MFFFPQLSQLHFWIFIFLYILTLFYFDFYFLYTTIHHFCKLFWLAASSGCFSKLLFYDDCKSSRGFKSQWKKVNSLGIAALQLGYREESVWLAKEKLWLGKTHVRPLLKFCRTFWLVSTKSRSCQQSVTILALQAASKASLRHSSTTHCFRLHL